MPQDDGDYEALELLVHPCVYAASFEPVQQHRDSVVECEEKLSNSDAAARLGGKQTRIRAPSIEGL
jgi:hypothetical protein